MCYYCFGGLVCCLVILRSFFFIVLSFFVIFSVCGFLSIGLSELFIFLCFEIGIVL